MVYKNADGNITIDEVAANADIHKMIQAVEKLSNASASLQSLINAASSMKGNTANAIVDQALQQKKQVDALIKNLESNISVIKSALNKYKEIDRRVTEAMRVATAGDGYSYRGGGSSAYGGGNSGSLGGR